MGGLAMLDPKAVLLDLDDTLTDRVSMFSAFAVDFIKDNYPGATGEKFASALKILYDIDYDPSMYRPKSFNVFARRTGLSGPPADELLRYWNKRFSTYMIVFDGVFGLLRGFRKRGLKVALVTNGDSELQNNKIDAAGLRDEFDVIVIGGDYPFEKPDTRIFRIALEKLGVDPYDAVFIGDNPVNDVIGSQNAGLTDIWMDRLGQTDMHGAKPTYTVHSIKELEEFSSGWGTRVAGACVPGHN